MKALIYLKSCDCGGLKSPQSKCCWNCHLTQVKAAVSERRKSKKSRSDISSERRKVCVCGRPKYEFSRQCFDCTVDHDDRNSDIIDMYVEGEAIDKIAKKHNLSKARVRVIIARKKQSWRKYSWDRYRRENEFWIESDPIDKMLGIKIPRKM